ncbi:hypothetical protein PVK06_003423 [Gossypium arboreum]|uniref:RNase H type-1 domain-containing protein n=1 Tax=Gossypium arboreum TaxID=29729 RepID=A0ABR0R677_GOSAR|nr:hypothetical protein PVK06_003423 [Gossypium arboreum]
MRRMAIAPWLYIFNKCNNNNIEILKNQNIHTFQEVPWNIEEIIKCAYNWAKHYGSIRRRGRERIGRHTSREDFVGTRKWICIRSDGVVKVNTGSASAGGVMRDQNGDWILGFNRKVGNCSVYEAELWGILDGMTLAQ